MAPSGDQWIAYSIGTSTLAWWWKIRFVDVFALRFLSLVMLEPRNSSWWHLFLRLPSLSIALRLPWHFNVALVVWPRVLMFFILVIEIFVFRWHPTKWGISSINCEIEFGQISFATLIYSHPIGKIWCKTRHFGQRIVKWVRFLVDHPSECIRVWIS